MSDVITSGARIVWGITCDDSDVIVSRLRLAQIEGGEFDGEAVILIEFAPDEAPASVTAECDYTVAIPVGRHELVRLAAKTLRMADPELAARVADAVEAPERDA